MRLPLLPREGSPQCHRCFRPWLAELQHLPIPFQSSNSRQSPVQLCSFLLAVFCRTSWKLPTLYQHTDHAASGQEGAPGERQPRRRCAEGGGLVSRTLPVPQPQTAGLLQPRPPALLGSLLPGEGEGAVAESWDKFTVHIIFSFSQGSKSCIPVQSL